MKQSVRVGMVCWLLLMMVQAGVTMAKDQVVVNDQRITPQQIAALKQTLGIPQQSRIEPGRYWYDSVSGLWGVEGGAAQGQIYPSLRLGGKMRADISGGGTSVFINGREIHPKELAFLRQLYGRVNPGRYWLNARGIGGYEGGPAVFNLYAAAQRSKSYSYTRRTLFGGIGGDSNCSYYLHPQGSSVMTCN